MPFTPKILGQVAAAAATYTVAYTVPSATNTTVSTITVSNANTTTARTFRIYAMTAADVVTFGSTSPQAKHFIAFDVTIGAADTTVMTLGITLATGSIVGVYSSAASSLAFNIFGGELT